MTRKTRRALVALVLSLAAAASNPGYVSSVAPWIAHHPAQAVEVIASGCLWCQSCGEAYELDRLESVDHGGEALYICGECREYLAEND